MSEGKHRFPKKRIIISTVIFLIMTAVSGLCFSVLGTENLLPATMMVVQALMISFAKIDEKPIILFLKVLVLNVSMCVLESVVYMNMWVGIFIVFGLVFCAATLLYRDRGMQVYFPFLLCNIYMMVGTPLPITQIGDRLIAMVGGAVLVGIAQIAGMKRMKGEAAGIANFMKKFEIDTKSVRFSFAFRLALGVTLMWFIVRFFDIEYGKWLVISVNSIVMPSIPSAKVKLRKRILGCVIGVAIFFVLHTLIHSLVVWLIILVAAAWCSIFFMSRYEVKCVCYSILSLSAIAFSEPAGMGFVIDRPLFVIIGGCFAMLINLFILRREEGESEPL
ncbi:MAG: FUSC family protein [Clostridia bacterium]|nr:FUSC family protein [Clostridia bacterium]